MERRRFLMLCGLAICISGHLAANQPPLRLATSTSTIDSGLLDILVPAFQQHSNYRVEILAVGTGTALRLARTGQVDVLLVHAPTAEKRFVREGYGLERHQIMHNDFVIVGPSDDPAGVMGLTDTIQAIARVRDCECIFLSRGDDSGTHRKERLLWRYAGIDPYGQNWYHELGLGIADVLRAAGERQAYTLTDRGTWLALKDQLELRLLVEGDALLKNPYGIIAVNPAKHPNINFAAANAFVEWMCSPSAQRLIRDYRKHGEPLFTPDLATE